MRWNPAVFFGDEMPIALIEFNLLSCSFGVVAGHGLVSFGLLLAFVVLFVFGWFLRFSVVSGCLGLAPNPWHRVPVLQEVQPGAGLDPDEGNQ